VRGHDPTARRTDPKEAAIILSFFPETSAVNVHPHAAVFQFDEVVSERGPGRGR